MNEQNGQVDIEAVKAELCREVAGSQKDGATVAMIRTDFAAAPLAHLERLEGVVTAACAWLDNMQHGFDPTDEGFSIPREQDEDALANAVWSYRLTTPPAASSEEGGE